MQLLLLNFILLPLSFLFRASAAIYRCCYKIGLLKANTLPGTVISVGNIAVGGTGKTPVVIELAKMLERAGKTVVILTRGYKSGLGKNQMCILQNGKIIYQTPEASGQKIHADEASLQSLSLPQIFVVVGRKRYQAALTFLNLGKPKPDFWLLDDGFQHYSLKRDLDIVLLDAKAPFGNGRFLPAGPLREGKKGLSRAALVLLTRASQSGASKLADVKAPVVALKFFAGELKLVTSIFHLDRDPFERVIVCAGLAYPQRLVDSLSEKNITPALTIFKGDHDLFSLADFPTDFSFYSGIVTSGKDFARDPRFFSDLGLPVFVLELAIDWPSELIAPYIV